MPNQIRHGMIRVRDTETSTSANAMQDTLLASMTSALTYPRNACLASIIPIVPKFEPIKLQTDVRLGEDATGMH